MEGLGKGVRRIQILAHLRGYLAVEEHEKACLRAENHRSALLAVLSGHSWALVTHD